MQAILTFLGTSFGLGKIPVAPGTWTSLATAVIIYFWQPSLPEALIALIVSILIGIPASYYTEKYYQRKDPSQCVIDEVVGQQVALLFFIKSTSYFLAAFLLFRFFDILKPFPVKKSEQIGYGIGVIADDFLAGAYALLMLKLFGLLFWR